MNIFYIQQNFNMQYLARQAFVALTQTLAFLDLATYEFPNQKWL